MKRGVFVLLLLFLHGSLLPAQVPDPAPLDRTQVLPGVHQKLLGQEHCIKCHDATQRANDQKCLDCHKEIQTQLDRGAAYHSNVVSQQGQICETCHKEHRGEAQKLTTWTDDETMKAFDHRPTGYALEQAHSKVECRKCHQPEFVTAKVSQRTRPEDSFIGLTSSCVSCHKDVHVAKLGTDCERCHTLEKWNILVPNAPFDHAKTDYALLGKHTKVDDCKKCHKSGRNMDELPFAACTDCHADKHQGQLLDRADAGKCDACHDVNGFAPALYELEDHRQSRYPLEGGHRAVACNACHKKEMIAGAEGVRLDFASFECEACHQSPTVGHVVELSPEKYNCKSCHTDARWQEVGFDHEQSKYKLTGRHRQVACKKCHQTEGAQTPEERVRYVEMAQDCSSCHQDVHAGQFPKDSCKNCHTTEDWKPTLFDHQKNSEYALVGKHLDAKCEACHRVESTADGTLFRRYKPIDKDCRICHGGDGSILAVFASNPNLSGIGRP